MFVINLNYHRKERSLQGTTNRSTKNGNDNKRLEFYRFHSKIEFITKKVVGSNPF